MEIKTIKMLVTDDCLDETINVLKKTIDILNQEKENIKSIITAIEIMENVYDEEELKTSLKYENLERSLSSELYALKHSILATGLWSSCITEKLELWI